ncbi:MAG: site-specific DNA-methyltransferase [Halanaerobiales bacterium]
MVEKVNKESVNIVADRMENLKKLFPEVFTEGKIDFNKLRLMLGDNISGEDERYSFNWAGKKEAIQNIQKPSVGTLIPAKEESIEFDQTDNIFIEGDNLEVLKLLQKSYANSIKMIYIDPPYNTGNDFVYKDNYKDNIQNYLEKTGQIDSEGNKLTTNTNANGRFHSDWLSMIYPRLFLAKNLLKEDGAIFISIEDNEVNNLMNIMNEIFGEENFIATFVWKRRSGANDAKNFVSMDHEYVLVYGNREFTQFNGILKDFSNYTNPDNDPRGPWAKDNLMCGKNSKERPNLYYPITDPKTGITYECNPNAVWRFEKEKMERFINEGKIIFPEDGNGNPMYKRHVEEIRSDRKPVSTWIDASTVDINDLAADQFENGVSVMQSPLNSYGTKELLRIFNRSVINYPKPSVLIKEFINQATSDGDIILDFFAGSATTAQAVLELNEEEDKNRKFIMVQLPEPFDNVEELDDGTQLNTIADVAKERIRRVINGYGDDPQPMDAGFKVFKLTKSNYKMWKTLDTAETSIEDLKKQMRLFQDSLVSDYNIKDVIYEVIIKEGYSLNSKIKKNTVGSNTIYKVEDNDAYFYISLDEKLRKRLLVS